MTPPRTIVHLDADCFFAAVEQAADAKFRGKPVAVGGGGRAWVRTGPDRLNGAGRGRRGDPAAGQGGKIGRACRSHRRSGGGGSAGRVVGGASSWDVDEFVGCDEGAAEASPGEEAGIGGGLLLILAFWIEGAPVLDIRAWAVVLWLASINTAFANTLYNHALQALTAIEMNVKSFTGS